MNEHHHQRMNESAGKSTALITRDLLGGGCAALDSSQGSEVPSGWDLKVYLQRCKSPNTSSLSSENKQKTNQTVAKLQDLNVPPSSKQPLNLFDDTSLDLKLLPASSSPWTYQNVCTLDKVKLALERAEKESVKKRSISNDDDDPSAYATGCPSCLLYVLISKSNPKCPRCDMIVPLPMAMKKPRIDLNISI